MNIGCLPGIQLFIGSESIGIEGNCKGTHFNIKVCAVQSFGCDFKELLRGLMGLSVDPYRSKQFDDFLIKLNSGVIAESRGIFASPAFGNQVGKQFLDSFVKQEQSGSDDEE